MRRLLLCFILIPCLVHAQERPRLRLGVAVTPISTGSDQVPDSVSRRVVAALNRGLSGHPPIVPVNSGADVVAPQMALQRGRELSARAVVLLAMRRAPNGLLIEVNAVDAETADTLSHTRVQVDTSRFAASLSELSDALAAVFLSRWPS